MLLGAPQSVSPTRLISSLPVFHEDMRAAIQQANYSAAQNPQLIGGGSGQGLDIYAGSSGAGYVTRALWFSKLDIDPIGFRFAAEVFCPVSGSDVVDVRLLCQNGFTVDLTGFTYHFLSGTGVIPTVKYAEFAPSDLGTIDPTAWYSFALQLRLVGTQTTNQLRRWAVTEHDMLPSDFPAPSG